jgi:hypothetical protein
MSDKLTKLTESQRNLIKCLPASCSDLARELDTSEATVRNQIMRIRERFDGDTIVYHRSENEYRATRDFALSDDEEQEELAKREEYILKKLPATTEELAKDKSLQVPQNIIEAYVENISKKGYHVEFDERTETWHSDESPLLRSTSDISQRTRAANEWWQKRHDELVKEFRGLHKPDIQLEHATGNQDVVSHVTDIHMGDKIYDDDGNIIYDVETAQDVIRYITHKQIKCVKTQRNITDFDVWHDLWGGDFVTGESIYDGQQYDIEATLDEQHDALFEPLMERIKSISQEIDQLNIICKTGNHGEQRASGKSRDANSDLILYKSIRNAISTLQEDAGMLQNVNFQIGSTATYKKFKIRGKFDGLLLHGEERKAGYRTSSEQADWAKTALNTDFDFAYAGHIHRDIEFSVEDRYVMVTGSPKPSGEFSKKIAALDNYDVGLIHGVSDDGITWRYDIDYRDFVEFTKEVREERLN